MKLRKVLVANRGEIAIRIVRAATELGLEAVTVLSEDDEASLHARWGETRRLKGSGASSYLDADQLVRVALEAECDAVHPGYGFLSENAAFARSCAEAGLVFVGPPPEALELFGDKARARALAKAAGVPVLPGTSGATSLKEAAEFLASQGGAAIMIKALAGGGGRGIQLVRSENELAGAFEHCSTLARSAFGNGDLYVELYMPRARHIEVQVAGDSTGAVTHLWERDCSVQRRHQKLVEIAPSPGLSTDVRERLVEAATELGARTAYENLGTFEFLVDCTAPDETAPFAFIEANPRLQVEHTVTEEVLDVDLVQAQLLLADGATLEEAGLPWGEVPLPRGFAIQMRVNLETMMPDGTVQPVAGTLNRFAPPTGPGVRVDTYGYVGYRTSTRYDSLLAKIIVHSPRARFADVAARAGRALSEFEVEGVATNIEFLESVVRHPAFESAELYTNFVDDHLSELVAAIPGRRESVSGSEQPVERGHIGARIDSSDPLAVLHYGKRAGEDEGTVRPALPEEPGLALLAPMQGTVVTISVVEGDLVRRGEQVLVLEAMKMQHSVIADVGGIVRQIAVAVGETVPADFPLVFVEQSDSDSGEVEEDGEWDLDEVRPDLAEVLDRHQRALDSARPEAVARRHARGKRTARENVEDICDPGTFREYGPLVIANRRSRHSVEELIATTPADGLVAGVGEINGVPSAVLSYDYTVLAGTQGGMNHRKTDRVLATAERYRLPVVFFTEGGGGRPGDDRSAAGGGSTTTFNQFARLSGLVPLVGIASGRCFAGNASLFGCCDVTIATADANLGMGGPAMIEGGGLGVFRPEEIGPINVQLPAGTIDVAVADEAGAVTAAKQYLSYFTGPTAVWEADDQRLLRHVIPEDRLRVYDIRRLIDTLADTGSVLELRRGFGNGMITALARVEGHALGIVANNPAHLAGAIDSDGADKAARFLQLCDGFDLPVVFLCDTPGIMVGPEIEKTALVRHSSRLFVIGANLSVPFVTIVLRKAYGLGAIAMAGGSFNATRFTLSWPTGEFFGMGIEGAVKLGYRHELEAIEDPDERRAAFDRMVAEFYEHGRATNIATGFGVDDVIDPADSRRWIVSAVKEPRNLHNPPKKRPFIDTW